MTQYSNTQMTGSKSPQKDPWFDWSAAKTPEANAALLHSMAPVIDRAVSTFGDKSPLSRSRAKAIVLNAAETYKPDRNTTFQTHAFNHLKNLQRLTAQAAQPVKIPERVSLDNSTLRNAEEDLYDHLGRPPSIDELADHTGIPVKRIRHIRRLTPGYAVSGAFEVRQDAEGGHGGEPAVERTSTLVRQLVHDDLNPIDQQIMDMAMAGVSNYEIAAKLNLSPGRITQRKTYIQRALDDAGRLDI